MLFRSELDGHHALRDASAQLIAQCTVPVELVQCTHDATRPLVVAECDRHAPVLGHTAILHAAGAERTAGTMPPFHALVAELVDALG